MTPNERLRKARVALHLSELETAARAGLTIYEVGDIEARADEFATAVPLESAFRLCSVVGISIYEALEVVTEPLVVDCAQGAYVESIRRHARLMPAALDEAIGYEIGFIDKVEAGDTDLLAYPAELALDIAKCTGSSAFQILRVLELQFSGRGSSEGDAAGD